MKKIFEQPELMVVRMITNIIATSDKIGVTDDVYENGENDAPGRRGWDAGY